MNTENQIQLLQKQVRRLHFILAAVVISFIAVGLLSFQKKDQVLRAKGLVIEDATGKPIILIGSPTPTVKGRTRTDAGTGIVFLDEKGTDRLLIGKMGKLQMGGKLEDRTTSGYGLVINEPSGDERGGFSFQDENDAIGLGLDYGGKDALEAIYLYASNQNAYLTLNGNVTKGLRDRIVLWHDNTQDLSLLKLADSNGERIYLKAQAGKPDIIYQDSKKTKTHLTKE